MIDSDFDIECGNECFGPGPPPEFRIPPPPRPPFLQEISKCTEEPLADFEMCQAIPVSGKRLFLMPSGSIFFSIFIYLVGSSSSFYIVSLKLSNFISNSNLVFTLNHLKLNEANSNP